MGRSMTAIRPESESDRTTKARIRDAALSQFSELGFKGATIRGIAGEAGVSPGLVQHHFGTKDGLRKACDTYVFELLGQVMDRGYSRGGVADPAFIEEMNQTMTPLVGYFIAAMNADSPIASEWFDMLVEFNRNAICRGDLGNPLSEDDDVDAIAAVFTGVQLGFLMMYEHVLGAVGGDASDPATIARIGRARLFVVSGELLGKDVIDRIQSGLTGYEQMHASTSARRAPENRE